MHAIAALTLGIFLVIVGIAHFAAPAYFRSLVPSWLPGAAWLVVASGVAELIVGGLLFAPATRTAGAWAAAALITGYLVSHVDALVHAAPDRRWLDRRPGAVARLVVNGGYIAWAVAVALTTS
ncbi:MAG TPA: MauE/DoxX family redox-associated membrane protein [Thermomonospora sp.]|nr:MauE/DoxX family redox-associated membrane protein [Thermomonospora sp.]